MGIFRRAVAYRHRRRAGRDSAWVVAAMLAAGLAAGAPGCGDGRIERQSAAPHGEIVVFAAASLADALPELGDRFEREHGWRAVFHFGSSGALARQIESGASAGVFFSADARRMDRLIRGDFVHPDERIEVLANELVVVVPEGAPESASGIEALTRARRVVIGDPQIAPAGSYAVTWLRRAGLWESLAGRIVPALDVRSALAAVEARHADAGIVYRTDVAPSRRVRVAHAVGGDEAPEIVYVIAPVGAPPSDTGPAATSSAISVTTAMRTMKAMQMDPSRHLVMFLASPSAAPVYERFGFRYIVEERKGRE